MGGVIKAQEREPAHSGVNLSKILTQGLTLGPNFHSGAVFLGLKYFPFWY